MRTQRQQERQELREHIAGLLRSFMRGKQNRLDANETGILARQLEHQLSKEKEIGYTPLRTLSFFPVSSEIDPGAESFRYEIWDQVGVAKIIANYADDLPMVDVVASEVFGSVKSIGDGYQYSRQDLRRSAKSGRNLPQRKRKAARAAMDRKIDNIAAGGEEASKLYGVLTHPNITILAAGTPGTGTDTEWTEGDKTNLEILADLHDLADETWLDTHTKFAADTMLLPPDRLRFIARTPMSVDNSVSILDTFLKATKTIKNVDSWHKLSTAGADGGPSALAYVRDPEVLEFHLPMGFTEHEPQVRNLAFVVPCEARVAGFAVYEPLGVVRMDGI
jgi:hypothetical protein